MIELSRIEEITDLRSVWEHEALDFTPWLANNINVLSEAIGIDIVVTDTESSVGDFFADIYAEEEVTGRKIVIENQLEETDHKHLGQIMTYIAGKDANIVIWVVKKARDEHKAAIEWLNTHTDDSVGFFLCETKLFKIGDSGPAVKFEVVERPNNFIKSVKTTKSTINSTMLTYWEDFKETVDLSSFTKANIAGNSLYLHWSAYSKGYVLLYRKNNIMEARLMYDNSSDLYEGLKAKKEEITELYNNIEWYEPQDKFVRSLKVSKTVDTMTAEEQYEWLITNAKMLQGIALKYSL